MWMYILTFVALLLGAIYWWFFMDNGEFETETKLVLNIKKTPAPLGGSLSRSKQKLKSGQLPMNILFYSQTGTAEDFANRLSEDAENYGFSPEVFNVLDLVGEVDELADTCKTGCLVFFAATYGEGDPPEEAVEFHEWLMDPEREPDTFEGVKYAVFGLGNKTYEHYNNVGTDIDRRMSELGAIPMLELGLGDDDRNIENDFLVWKKTFKPTVCEAFKINSSGSNELVLSFKQKMIIHEQDDLDEDFDYDNIERWKKSSAKVTTPDVKDTLLADITVARELMGKDAGRSCVHIEVNTHGVLKYKTGYHIGIFSENSPELVNELATVLKLDLSQVVSMEYEGGKRASAHSDRDSKVIGPCSVKALLTQYYDLTFHAKKQAIKVLAYSTKDDEEKKRLLQLCSDDPDEQDAFQKYIVGDNRTIVEVLKDFPGAVASLNPSNLFEFLPKILPRLYSISSSSIAHPESVHITAVVEDWETPLGRRAMGLATGWLSRNGLNTVKLPSIPCYISHSNFLMPASLSTSFFMVGPGTGFAPFRGFLQERRHLLSLPENKDVKRGECILFFGSRTEDDHLYKEEMESYLEDGTLTGLSISYSRAQEEKVYVQHKIKEGDSPKQIWKILDNGGYFYLCGDASHMANDVCNAVMEVISQEGNMSMVEAKAYLAKMGEEHRQHKDVW